MEKDYNVVILDGVVYTEIDRLKHNNNSYILLSNLDNPRDFCIKKVIIDNNEEYAVQLDSEEEFRDILNLIALKY